MSDREPGPDDQDLLAAEYVLGALSPEQARALEALALHDPAVAASVGRWQDRLAPLAQAVVKPPPPPVLWQRLALATGIESVMAGPPGRRGVRRVWRSPGLWRATTVASLAVAASLAFLMFGRLEPANQPLLAALSPYGAPGATFLVRVNANGLATVVAAGDPGTPQGRALELWAVNAGAARPVSLGLLPGSGRKSLAVPNHAGTQLLVSQEPEGGSPTGQPTGPVVYAGTLTGA